MFAAEGAGVWLLVGSGSNGMITVFKASSTNLNSWENLGSQLPGDLNGGMWLAGLIYGEGKWVLYGNLNLNGGMSQSLWISEDDGQTWADRSASNMTLTTVQAAAIGEGKLVVTDQIGRLFVSSDMGISWSEITLPSNQASLAGLAYGNHRFVLAGSDGTVWTSTDGAVTWVQQLAPYPFISWQGANQLSSVVFGGGLFVLSDGRCSSDGVVWTSPSKGIPQSGLGGVIAPGGNSNLSMAHGPAGFLVNNDNVMPAGMSANYSVYQAVSADVPAWSPGAPSSEKIQTEIPFTRTFQASGATSYQALNLPDWMSFDSATGTLSGTPTNPVNPVYTPPWMAAPSPMGTSYTIVLYATNGSGTSDALTYNLQVSPDITPPQITLLGENPITIYKRSGPYMPGTGFTDPGAQVTDDHDWTRTIYGMGWVNDMTIGIYTLIYTATDSYGNMAVPVTRTVNVVLDPTGDEDGDGLTNQTEITLGTDLYNHDTDGDGYGDGAEVAAGKNPLDPASRPGRVFYVKRGATGANDGSSWLNAFPELQPALDAVDQQDDEVWVAAGTYLPTAYIDPLVTTDSRSKTFMIFKGMKIYGGFSGGEILLTQRDPQAHSTILSGDFSRNDSESWPYQGSSRNENAYHVVTTYPKENGQHLLLDGFTITGGTPTTTIIFSRTTDPPSRLAPKFTTADRPS